MIRLRRSADRGYFRDHWLDARFSFSFGDYQDRAFDGWSDLLVLNEDRVAPGGGFAEHGHQDVEVMSYPVSGAVEHRDALGSVVVLRPGDVHWMRAGRGIRHSEMNAFDRAPEHHLQWWIRPAVRGLEPSYQRVLVPPAEKHNRCRQLASPAGGHGVLTVAQDVRVLAARVDGSKLRQVGGPTCTWWTAGQRSALRRSKPAMQPSSKASPSSSRPRRPARPRNSFSSTCARRGPPPTPHPNRSP